MLRSSSTRLVNVLGRTVAVDEWKTATLFLLPHGIVYADPELPWWQNNKEQKLRVRTDALEIPRRAIQDFAQSHSEWWISCNLRFDRQTEERAYVRSASYDLALNVLKDLGGPLFQHLPPLLE